MNVHSIYVDSKDNVWIVGNGRGDSHILKFDYNGKFLLQGCGAMCGTLEQISACGEAVARGYACGTTDMGHRAPAQDGKWAFANPVAENDLGHRGTHVAALAGKAITATLGGHVDFVSASASSAVSHLKAGTVRVIGITAPKRIGGVFADVPTFLEQGVSDIALKTNKPCIFGVITTNTEIQALERAGGKLGNKGSEAAEAALWMLFTKESIDHQ
mgnify:CR=1 FL=1